MNTKAGEHASLEQRQEDLKKQLGEKRGALDAALLREQFASEPEYLDARRGPGAVEGLKLAIGAHEDAVKGAGTGPGKGWSGSSSTASARIWKPSSTGKRRCPASGATWRRRART